MRRGAEPPIWLKQRVDQLPFVELHGDVPDVRPFLYRASMMVVPLRIGGGSRLKILEALATGLPVISTRVGAEGLRLQPDLHYTQADRVEDIADAIVTAMRTPLTALAQAQAGRELIEQHYDWAKLAGDMEQAWQLLRDADSAARSGHALPVSGSPLLAASKSA